MSQAPSMPMYWDAYLADTTHLTTEEHGAYLLLLAAMWRRNGSVPDDDKDNARIVGLSVGKWRKFKARISDLLIIEGEEITQKKLQKNWKKVKEISQKNSENGAKGGRPKSKENSNLAKANGSVSDKPNKSLQNHNQNHKEKEPNGSSKTQSSKADQEAEVLAALSGVCSEAVAKEFVEHRNELKKPLTPRAAKALANKVQGHPNPDAVFNDSISNGWQGVFPEKVLGKSQTKVVNLNASPGGEGFQAGSLQKKYAKYRNAGSAEPRLI